jgi:hypothetical protein
VADLSWRDAILKVLEGSAESMHYSEIAGAVAEQGLRTDFGATPAATVNSVISTSINNEGKNSPFVRLERGRYSLRKLDPNTIVGQNAVAVSPAADDTGLINAFGMFWARQRVLWTAPAKILGQQQPGSKPVDFAGEKGVYLLHDGREVVYVGRTTEQPLGIRLRQHVSDRLNGRWDRFSWFGVYPVADSGALDTGSIGTYDLTMLIVTMEALLIEGLEPPQNRKRGDDFRAVEFLQVEDPEIQKTRILDLMDELKSKL